MSKKHIAMIFLGLFLLAVYLVTNYSCSKIEEFIPTKIGDILKNPRKYEGKKITVRGTVTDSFSLLNFRYFILKDETGEIFVVTNRIPPTKGETLNISGKIDEAFAIEDKRLVVIIEDEK